MAGVGALGCDVSLLLSFSNLKSKDMLSKSDPFAVVYVQDGSRPRALAGKTSVVRNRSSGGWPESIELHFRFEEKQTIYIDVFDFDDHSNHDLLGQCAFALGSLMGSPGQTCTYKLSKHGGEVRIVGEKKSNSGGNLHLHMCAYNLDSKDLFGFGRSDPFYTISRQVGGEWNIVHRSEWIKNNNNPKWAPASVPMEKICRGDPNLPLKVSVYDYDEGSQADMIGEFMTTVNELLQASGGRRRFDVKHPPTKRKYQKSSYVNSGQVEVTEAKITPSPTSLMLDYIAGGLSLNLIVAVDFTASNGDPNNPNSLHYRSPHMLNQYQAAISSVGAILQPYDTDGMIPAFGFGGIFQGNVNHCFPLNGNHANPEVHGVQGVMQAYEQALYNVRLSGPTYFAPLLQTVNGIIHNPELSQQAQSYTILLILTDGAIMDMQPTIDQIVQGADKPLSIVIVGVGSADMSAMEVLDADKGSLVSNGRKASRDIVQFVPFSSCNRDGELLAKKTLAEVPHQLVSFFQQRRIIPNPPLKPSVAVVPLDGIPIDESAPIAMASAAPSVPAQDLGAAGKVVLAQAFAL